MHVKELLSLKNRICLVTGGAGRYGRCIVEGLAEADATVVTASRSLDANEQAAESFRSRGLDVHALCVDQADHASVCRLKEDIRTQFGGLDVFVNNSVARPMRGYRSAIEDFAESMRVNATGMFDITREMTDLLEERGKGVIIHISSMMGMFGPDLSNYEGTLMGDPPPDYFFHNAGLLNLARYQAHILADKNIRVNCICPGGLYAPEIQPERFLRNYTGKVLAGRRMANTDDIKGVVVFLASDASAYITGESILMDGGMHC